MSVELGRDLAELVRAGRRRRFSPRAFEALLAGLGGRRHDLLRRAVQEWTGLALTEREAPALFARVLATHDRLRRCLGAGVSLQTALMHELHTRLGRIADPQILGAREVEELRVDAVTDPLTRLYNRRFLQEHLTREIARAERTGAIVSVVLMDLQGFKAINDRLGHPVGDSVLVRAARIIRESLRAVDAGCRFGGDEFMAVLPNTSLVHSLAVAERIRGRVGALRLPKGAGMRVGLHYGVASYPTDAHAPDFLIRVCDRRLYDCRRHDSDPRSRRFPRFTVQGLTFNLARPVAARSRPVEVRDIGLGGLSLVYPGERAPAVLKGDLVQQFSADSHPVAVRPVNVVPMRGGWSRVGCAYVH